MTADDENASPFRLRVDGPGITIDKMVDARLAGAVASLAFGGVTTDAVVVPDLGASPLPTLGTTARPQSPNIPGQRLSLREYLQNADVDRGIHGKILAVGRYMRDHEQQSDFDRDDVRSRFRSAGEPQPANFHRDFQKAVRAGWIAEDHQNPGRFYVTRSGDDEINRRQQGEPAGIRVHRPRRRTRQRPPASDGSVQ